MGMREKRKAGETPSDAEQGGILKGYIASHKCFSESSSHHINASVPSDASHGRYPERVYCISPGLFLFLREQKKASSSSDALSASVGAASLLVTRGL